MRRKLQITENLLVKEEAQKKSLQEKLSAAIERIQEQGKEHSKNKETLIDNYENELKALNTKLNDEANKLYKIQKDFDKLQNVEENNIELNNKMISLKRAHDEAQ